MRRELGGPRSPASDLGILVLPISLGRGMALSVLSSQPPEFHPLLGRGRDSMDKVPGADGFALAGPGLE